ncbi:NADH-ubiquinone oxidoreductase, chain 4L [Thioalkalivibrio nitratireducens DSM 14787]|uniref:NADH-ubiquinone oxidoreductase n=2 Tax=Thioalkalivibrio TaxID=106633 RepID=W0DJ39_9GAMM|nr:MULTISPECIES: Na+/H+ antiporter subunit C [Thioalkalivibrio]AGA31807.1 NADH-ubiquinone oxidoreductase, chain 4L [Thioalkalivibrio nitratireducens DSM 14787]AHE97018.1 NADH-ubiquinone oxidoreductase [Thioalkalivibrio paradoxus ARh 1]
MSGALAFAWSGVLLFGLGLFGFIMHRHLLRRLLAFNIMGSGSFLVLVGLAQDGRGVDPVPHAMVITGIVVAVASTALALVVFRRWYRASGRTDLPEDT